MTELKLEDFATCIATVPTSVDINFSGYAEPWLNDRCTEMVEFAAGRGHGIKIFTTLVGMTPSDVARLAALGVKRWLVHLPDDGEFMNVRVDDRYLSTLEAVVKLARPEIKFMAIGKIAPSVLPHVSACQVSGREVISRAGNVSQLMVIGPPALMGPIRCYAERLHRNVLLPNGDVTLCCMDYGRTHVLGNLLRQTYADLFEGEEFRRVVKGMNSDNDKVLCRTCEFAVPSEEQALALIPVAQ